MATARTIVVVGAGFSGTVTAAHLLRGGAEGGLRVILVNRSGPMARGVAYGTRIATHVLNVPAGKMSAFADDATSFLRFARQHDPTITADTFVSRSLYGDYLEQLLSDAEQNATPGASLERLVGEAVAIEMARDGRCAQVMLADGRSLSADRVVLALGNYAPANPRVADARFYKHPRYTRDPWLPGALDEINPDESVLLIGTGLTMVDVALALQMRGVQGHIWAVSRHGLLPQPHKASHVAPNCDVCPPGIEIGPHTARGYLRAVRAHVKTMAGQGVDWRDVLNALRPLTPALWQSLCLFERARFLRHVRPFWEVHRHRTAPEIANALDSLRETGALTVLAGRIARFNPDAQGVTVFLQRRGQAEIETIRVSRVINCTGPISDMRTLRDPLMDFLRVRGLIRPDPLGLGLLTAENGALFDAHGNASRILYHVGPLLKGRYWESTAVPELRVHAERLASTLLHSLPSETAVVNFSQVEKRAANPTIEPGR